MNLRLLVLALSLALTGCPLTPKLNETTPPTLYFTIWYQNASHNSASDEIPLVTALSQDANKCIFVASPFLVRVIGSDPGGVARLDVSNQGNNSLRVLNALSTATPPPGSPTQGDPIFGTFANPGSPFDPNANGSQLSYFDFDAQKGGPVFNVATLEATFEFVAGQPPNGVLLMEAFNASGVPSRLVNYKVMLAGSASNQQPGMPCSVPRSAGAPQTR
jgi:hypothetical protein